MNDKKQDTVELKKKQVDMHRDFFDRAENAVNNRFYLEAIFLEYAAIESRLEVILGVLGYPCNKDLDSALKKNVNISDRINCLRVCRNNNKVVFKKTHLPSDFFNNKGPLKKWICNRNMYIHGLFKKADEYTARNKELKNIAKKGLVYAKLLYNEAARLRRLYQNHPDLIAGLNKTCKNNNCSAIKNTNKEG